MTALMPVPLQSSAIVKHSSTCWPKRWKCLQTQRFQTVTCLVDILNEAVFQHEMKALSSLFDVEFLPDGNPRPPPSTAERGQDLWTISKRSRGELQLFMSRPEGCEQTGRLRNSDIAQLRKYIFCTMKVQHCKSHEALNKKAGSGSSGCISARSCLSAAAANTSNASASAEHLVPRLRPGPLDHVQRSHVELQFSVSNSTPAGQISK